MMRNLVPTWTQINTLTHNYILHKKRDKQKALKKTNLKTDISGFYLYTWWAQLAPSEK